MVGRGERGRGSAGGRKVVDILLGGRHIVTPLRSGKTPMITYHSHHSSLSQICSEYLPSTHGTSLQIQVRCHSVPLES